MPRLVTVDGHGRPTFVSPVMTQQECEDMRAALGGQITSDATGRTIASAMVNGTTREEPACK